MLLPPNEAGLRTLTSRHNFRHAVKQIPGKGAREGCCWAVFVRTWLEGVVTSDRDEA